MTPPSERPLRIAILLNSYRSPHITEIRDSYTRSLHAVAHDAQLSFFYPAERADDFPDPTAFDLIVVGGGNADPRRRHPWILRVHAFILDVVTNHPRKKICGICWGHQTISLLFGGEVVEMETPEVCKTRATRPSSSKPTTSLPKLTLRDVQLGVTEAKLTPAGRRFFGRHLGTSGALLLQQHHRRAVGITPGGFTELLVGNQCLLSHNNSVLTFQGHPEKDAQCAKLRVRDAIRWFGIDEDDRATMACFERSMERPHDGAAIWGKVLDWVRERHPAHEMHL